MSTPDPERQVSIWTVPERWRKLFFAIFSLQTAALIGLAVWYEVFVVTGDTWLETIFAIGRDAEPGIAVVAADSVVTVVVVMILTLLYEDYRRKRTERALARLQERWLGLESTQAGCGGRRAAVYRSRRLPSNSTDITPTPEIPSGLIERMLNP